MVCYKADGIFTKWANADASLHATSLRAWVSMTSSTSSFSLPINPQMAAVIKSGQRLTFYLGIPGSQNLVIEGHTAEGVSRLYDDFTKGVEKLSSMISEIAGTSAPAPSAETAGLYDLSKKTFPA
jgi:hypothetical protein